MKFPFVLHRGTTPLQRRLDAAEGFLELSLPLEAHLELDGLEPDERHLSEVLILRVSIYRRVRQWALMEATARVLYRRDPFDPGHVLAFAEATRHAKGLTAAIRVLIEAVGRVSDCAALVYQLALYESLDGKTMAARKHLAEAIEFVPEYRELAEREAALRPLLGDR